jgi:WD40 repeat protein
VPVPTSVILDQLPSISFDEYNALWNDGLNDASQRAALSPDGKVLATVGHPNSYLTNIAGDIFLWNIDRLDQPFKAFSSVISYSKSVTFSYNGRYMAVGGCSSGEDCPSSKIVVFDWETGAVIDSMESKGHGITQIQFTPDDENIVAQDVFDSISIWNLHTREVTHPSIDVTPAGAHGFVISPLGDTITVGSQKGIHLLNLQTLSPISLRTGTSIEYYGPIIAASLDQKWLIASGCDQYGFEICTNRTILMWKDGNSTPNRTLSLGATYLYALAFNPDGDIFAAGSTSGIRMWNAASGRELQSPYSSQSTFVFDIVFYPDGSHFVAVTNTGLILGEVSPDRSSWAYTSLNRLGYERKYIITPAGDNLNCHLEPAIDSPVQRKLRTGEVITVFAGPKNVDGHIWWGVRAKDVEEGWIVENPDWYAPVP